MKPGAGRNARHPVRVKGFATYPPLPSAMPSLQANAQPGIHGSAQDGAQIHLSAMVSEDSCLAPTAVVGPGCVLHGKVTLGDNVRLIGGVHLSGPISIGAGTMVYPYACLGFPAQDYKIKPGDPTAGVVIGSGCIIREHVTVHAATKQDVPTIIGDNVFMMVGSHAAHDTRVGNNVVMVNGVALGGHVQVAERVNLGGQSAVHQFCRIGRLAMTGGNSTITTDVPPFCIATERNMLQGLNVIGLRRSGVPRDQITMLRTAYREVIRIKKTKEDIVDGLARIGGDNPLIAEIIEFYKTSRRTICPSAALPPRQFRAWMRHAKDMADEVEGDEGQLDGV